MFGILPLELKQREPSRAIPWANFLLIGVNCCSYLLMVTVGWYSTVGPLSGPLSVLLYGFCHAGLWHLVFNMWALWVFGNPVNRRLGNGHYLITYLGTILFLGLFARLFFYGNVIGASGGIFAVIIIACMLMPADRLSVAWFALFPLTLLIGIVSRPRYGIYWFIRGGEFTVKALWCVVLIPLLELVPLFFGLWTPGGNVWNLGHLLGMVCGVVGVLLLPTRITMRRSSAAGRFSIS